MQSYHNLLRCGPNGSDKCFDLTGEQFRHIHATVGVNRVWSYGCLKICGHLSDFRWSGMLKTWMETDSKICESQHFVDHVEAAHDTEVMLNGWMTLVNLPR